MSKANGKGRNFSIESGAKCKVGDSRREPLYRVVVSIREGKMGKGSEGCKKCTNWSVILVVSRLFHKGQAGESWWRRRSNVERLGAN
jgi:hypothetical protein